MIDHLTCECINSVEAPGGDGPGSQIETRNSRTHAM